MKHLSLVLAFSIPLAFQHFACGDDAVFSGPQIGERLPPFKAVGLYGSSKGKDFDLVTQAGGKPVVVVFAHERTRPAYQLVGSIAKLAAERAKQGLQCGIIYLTDDVTATEQWARGATRETPEGLSYGVSHDGKEGPGSYGLNRNVQMTVLVGNEGKVTANFALAQPSLQADGPKIFQAIVDVTGGGKVPTLAELSGGNGRMEQMELMERLTKDKKLAGLLRPVTRRRTKSEEVARQGKLVEEYVATDEKARQELGRIATTATASAEELAKYGTKPAQELLRKWAKEYGAAAKEEKDGSK